VIEDNIETPHGDQVPRTAATTAITTAETVNKSTPTSVLDLNRNPTRCSPLRLNSG
jgi:hypothetical protein